MEKASLRDAAVAQRKSIEAQLALSRVVRLDPELKVLSENEEKRKDGYCLRVKLQPWSNPEQGGQGRVFRHWEVIRAATGTPVREGGAEGRGERALPLEGGKILFPLEDERSRGTSRPQNSSRFLPKRCGMDTVCLFPP